MLLLALWPALIALTLWIGLAWFYWDAWTEALEAIIARWGFASWLTQRGFSTIVHYLTQLLLFLLIAPAILTTTVAIAAVIEMPLIVKFVAHRDHPDLAMLHGGSVIGSVANASTAIVVFATLWIVTLPLWLTGVLAPIISIALSAFLNQRLFRYDALAEHASRDEYRAIVTSNRIALYALGALLGLMYWVPLLNLAVPVLSGLAYTYFCLGKLAALRARIPVRS